MNLLQQVQQPLRTALSGLVESPEPYVAGTLYAIRAVRERVGLTRGLAALLA